MTSWVCVTQRLCSESELTCQPSSRHKAPMTTAGMTSAARRDRRARVAFGFIDGSSCGPAGPSLRY